MINDKPYLVAPGVVSEQFDNEVIIVNMARGHYYSLRNSAADVWQLLELPITADQLVAHLTDRYSVDNSDAHTAIASFLTHLLDEQLITVSNNFGSALQILESGQVERQPFIAPVLEVYTDMADLLALDPIHDVDPVEGWPSKK